MFGSGTPITPYTKYKEMHVYQILFHVCLETMLTEITVIVMVPRYPSVNFLYFASLFSSRAASSAAGRTVWYMEAIGHTDQIFLFSKVIREANKIQVQLWVISVSPLATLSLWQNVGNKVSPMIKFQWCS